jgi:Sulfotransferase domain
MSNGKVLRLPGFIHVGPPRTGTTWLHEALKGHIGLPKIKETRFFDTYYNRGVEWYCNTFDDYPPEVPAGEMGPTYFSNAVARERIKLHIPDCKIIITLREPAARLYSMYRLTRAGRHPAEDTFEEYWRYQIDCGGDLCSYAAQLKRWQATFGKSRVLVRFYEDLSSDPQGYLDSICDFIGARRVALDSVRTADTKVYSAPTAAHSSALGWRSFAALYWASRHGARPLLEFARRTALGKMLRRKFVEDFEPLSAELADEIRAMTLPETEELERMTGRDLSSWKPRSRRKFDEGHAAARSQTG